jgi:hypothetical protein
MGGATSVALGGSFWAGFTGGALVGAVTGLMTAEVKSYLQRRAESNDARSREDLYASNEGPSPNRGAKEGVSWLTRLRRFFGIGGTEPSNTLTRVGGQLVNTGISLLKPDVLKGFGDAVILRNLQDCVGAGICIDPDDTIILNNYLISTPPNYQGVVHFFFDKGWAFETPLDLLNRGGG